MGKSNIYKHMQHFRLYLLIQGTIFQLRNWIECYPDAFYFAFSKSKKKIWICYWMKRVRICFVLFFIFSTFHLCFIILEDPSDKTVKLMSRSWQAWYVKEINFTLFWAHYKGKMYATVLICIWRRLDISEICLHGR